MEKKPKVLEINKTKTPNNGVTVYGKVQSLSKPKVQHTVTKDASGFHCSCDAGMFNPGTPCVHIKAFKKKL